MGNNLKTKENNEEKNKEEISRSKDISQEKLNELKNRVDLLEKRLINKFAYPLNYKSLYYENIPISFQKENHYLHTLVYNLNELKENPNTEKKILIIIHGYQANGLNFYKIIPYIYQKFICICPDIIGMGLSSRINIEFTSNEQCIKFFIESIEAFRASLEKNYGLNKKFILCGHSLGGLFVVNYALKYFQYIDSLFLMSPAGITDVEKYGGTIFENMNLSRSLTMRGISPLFKSKYTLQDISQTFLIKNIINSQLKKR